MSAGKQLQRRCRQGVAAGDHGGCPARAEQAAAGAPVHQGVGVQGTQTFRRILRIRAQLLLQTHADRFRLGLIQQGQTAAAGTALENVALGNPRAARCHHVHTHAGRTGGLAEQGDIVGIAAKRRDVLFHPMQGQLLVFQRRVTGSRQRRMAQEPEGAETVIQRHHHRVAFLRQPGTVVLIAATGDEGSAVDKHHHRCTTPGNPCRCVHVQAQAILTLLTTGRQRAGALHAGRAELFCSQYARPVLHRQRCGKALFPHWRLSIGNPQKCAGQPGLGICPLPLDPARSGFDIESIATATQCKQHQHDQCQTQSRHPLCLH